MNQNPPFPNNQLPFPNNTGGYNRMTYKVNSDNIDDYSAKQK